MFVIRLLLIIYSVFLCCFISTEFATANSISQPNQKSMEPTLKQLTQDAVDASQVLSPDGKWLAYVAISNFIVPSDCHFLMSKGEYGNAIWIVDLKKLKKRLLVPSHFSCHEPTQVILDPQNLQFSPDSKTLYFIAGAWVVSGALHAVDINGKNLRFVTDANEYQVVMDGRYKGDLIVTQHRYRFHGDEPLGSYDWDWLYTPTGKQIKLYQRLE